MAKAKETSEVEGGVVEEQPAAKSSLRSTVVYRVLSKRGQLIIPDDDEQLARMLKGEIIPRDQLTVLRVEPGQTTDRVPLASERVLQTSGWICVAGSDEDPYRGGAAEAGLPETIAGASTLEGNEAMLADEAARLAPRIAKQQELFRRLREEDATRRRLEQREAQIIADRVARAEGLLSAHQERRAEQEAKE